MFKNMLKQLKRLYSFTGTAKVYLIAGTVGNSFINLLYTIMTANLIRDLAKALIGDETFSITDMVINALPYAFSIIVINTISDYLSKRAESITAAHMRENLMDKIIKTPLRDMNNKESGILLSYFTNDITASVSGIRSSLEIALTAIILGIGSFIYVLLTDISLLAYLVIIGILTYLYSLFFAKYLYKISISVQEQKADMLKNLKKLLDGTVVSKIYDMRELLYTRFDRSAEKAMKLGIKWARISGVLGSINNFAGSFSMYSIIFLSGLLFFSNRLDVPTVLWVSQMGIGFVGIFYISRSLPPILQSLAGAQRIFDIMDEAKVESSGERSMKYDLDHNAVEFKNVSFNYDKDIKVIKNLTISIKPGEIVAVSGQSGSGKTTLLRLIQALYLPSEGTIDILGLSINQWDIVKLRQMTSLVSQENILFTGTVYDNITLGCDGQSETDVYNAAKLSGAHEFSMDLPNKYNTMISERGSSLSGGEKQRISIARAILRDSPIMLLDEPTSALDIETENILINTITRYKGDKTIILVAHKPQLLKIADKVIHLDI